MSRSHFPSSDQRGSLQPQIFYDLVVPKADTKARTTAIERALLVAVILILAVYAI
jgi:hypothetical protein